jgi:hypothetical protein
MKGPNRCLHGLNVGHLKGQLRGNQGDTVTADVLIRWAGLKDWNWWFAAGQLPGYEHPEAGIYSFYDRPSTTCVARSVAVDSITR